MQNLTVLHLDESGRARVCLDCPFVVRRSNLGGLYHGNGLVDVARYGRRAWLRRSVALEESDGYIIYHSVGRDWILHLCQRVPPGANAPTAQKPDNKIIGARVVRIGALARFSRGANEWRS